MGYSSDNSFRKLMRHLTRISLVAAVVLSIAKLAGGVTWSWAAVTSPLWGFLALKIAIDILVLICFVSLLTALVTVLVVAVLLFLAFAFTYGVFHVTAIEVLESLEDIGISKDNYYKLKRKLATTK